MRPCLLRMTSRDEEDTAGRGKLEEDTAGRGQLGSSQGKLETRAGEAPDLATYVFGKPGELDRDLARLGTSRRRFLTINVSALVAPFRNILHV